ncbi:hypothetical protein RR46_02594 [Papilio xuthus]|uniref:Uncharacterized protein n=1 Tax=Papilio xuthus TaxID=66420 RepID=A0A194Q8E8_PAPXU|nr:hypothetical protein RR46_02594 [Papilio xuthus]
MVSHSEKVSVLSRTGDRRGDVSLIEFCFRDAAGAAARLQPKYAALKLLPIPRREPAPPAPPAPPASDRTLPDRAGTRAASLVLARPSSFSRRPPRFVSTHRYRIISLISDKISWEGIIKQGSECTGAVPHRRRTLCCSSLRWVPLVSTAAIQLNRRFRTDETGSLGMGHFKVSSFTFPKKLSDVISIFIRASRSHK